MAHLRVSVRALAEAKPTPTFRRGRDWPLMAKRTLLAESVVGENKDNTNLSEETDAEVQAVNNEEKDAVPTKITILFICSVAFFYNFDVIGPYLTLYFLKYTSSSNVSISHLLH
jgi:hypothetical protein